MTAADCLTCGHPALRPAGHASFCEPWNEANPVVVLSLVPTVRRVDETSDNGAPGPVVAGPQSGQRPERRLSVVAPASTHEQEAPALTDASMTTAG